MHSLTDTPTKNIIEAEKAACIAKKQIKKERKPIKNTAKPMKKLKFKKLYDSDSEDLDEPLYDESGLSEEDFEELEDPDIENIIYGAYVLVKIAGKTMVKHFAVLEVCDTYPKIQYLKRDGNSQKFKRDDLTVYDIDKSDVLFKLPHPIVSRGSTRQLEKFTFGVNLDTYNIE